jgi:phospholipid-translocating ATPase
LNLENTLWSSTVLATDTIVGLVVYTGSDTRSVLNTSTPETKKGVLDGEIQRFTIALFLIQLTLSILLVVFGFFKGVWWLNFFRFLVLVSAFIPISMSVNLEVAKFVYAWLIVTDTDIPGCVVRNTTIPEELGRISFLLSDKTGTFTQNGMHSCGCQVAVG